VSAAVVVPCFNEAQRLQAGELLRLADAGLLLWLVDDGSTDRTRDLLEALRTQRPASVRVLALQPNQGKAEAVRRGLVAALGQADVVAYLDADLSTPVDEVFRLLEALDEPGKQAALGSRVARAGAAIERRAARHLAGRAFATAASAVLGEPFYDTQCGAKAFRATAELRSALGEPFASRWAFDVELLGRLLREGVPFSAFVEVPLRSWRDVKGSKLGPVAMARAAADLLAISRRLARWGRR
jgi:glycosyltransferase involved in cell wall biosynthesis